jgi:hypothetical protein
LSHISSPQFSILILKVSTFIYYLLSFYYTLYISICYLKFLCFNKGILWFEWVSAKGPCIMVGSLG